MPTIGLQPPIGYYTPLGDFVAFLETYDSWFSENTADPESKLNHWFLRWKNAVIYDHDTPPHAMGCFERQLNPVTFCYECVFVESFD